MPAAGSVNPSTATATMTASPESHSHARRCPYCRENQGMWARSTIGAHAHLKLYTSSASAKAEIERFSIPASESRFVRVAASNANGNPEEIPRNRAAKGAASKYGRTPAGKRLRHVEARTTVPRSGMEWAIVSVTAGRVQARSAWKPCTRGDEVSVNL